MLSKDLAISPELFKFINFVFVVRIKMPKMLKHDLGSMLVTTALNCQRAVAHAYIPASRQQATAELLAELDVAWALLRLCYNHKGISAGEYKTASELLTNLNVQAQKWHNWALKNAGCEPAPR
jgi:hypothetical protein